MSQVYRHFDKQGNLLYVGCSLSAVHRLSQHSQVSPWFTEIAKIDVEKFNSRDAALAAERQAIQTEKPKYNKRLTKPPVPPRPAAEASATELLRKITKFEVAYTLQELGKIFNCGPIVIRNLIAAGKLGSIKLSRNRLPVVTGWQLIEFLENESAGKGARR